MKSLRTEQSDEIKMRAGVHTDAQEASTEECFQFNSLADALCTIHAAKAIHYGDYLKTHGDETPQLFAVQHFCDIKRKYVRAKTFVERMTRGEEVDFTDLLDTYSDLAVYAIMGLQMAFHCRERMQIASGKCPKCGVISGDDWSNCYGKCPMPASPYYGISRSDRKPGECPHGYIDDKDCNICNIPF